MTASAASPAQRARPRANEETAVADASPRRRAISGHFNVALQQGRLDHPASRSWPLRRGAPSGSTPAPTPSSPGRPRRCGRSPAGTASPSPGRPASACGSTRRSARSRPGWPRWRSTGSGPRSASPGRRSAGSWTRSGAGPPRCCSSTSGRSSTRPTAGAARQLRQGVRAGRLRRGRRGDPARPRAGRVVARADRGPVELPDLPRPVLHSCGLQP